MYLVAGEIIRTLIIHSGQVFSRKLKLKVGLYEKEACTRSRSRLAVTAVIMSHWNITC